MDPSDVAGGTVPAARPGRLGRFVAWLKTHPIVCLALLTPGLPEYLSSSTSIVTIVLNPVAFVVFLAINVGQYTAGALLIREAAIRWRKGWATIFLLAIAYGITEEGLGDNTLFNSTHGTDGVLGHFGRFLGVNWVWSVGVLAFHVVFSIGVPLLLLGLALPATRGRSLIGRRGIATAFLGVAASTFVEAEIVLRVDGFWMGLPLFFGSLAAIAVVVAVAYRIPREWGEPRHPGPTARPRTLALLGVALFPCLFAVEYGLAPWPGLAVVAVLLDVAVLAGFWEGIRRTVGRAQNDRWTASLAFGFVGFLAAFGLFVDFPVPFTLPLVVLAFVFCGRLVRGARTLPSP